MDFANVKKIVIPEGEVKQIESNGALFWKKMAFTNQVPISTDTDGAIYNGVGYKDDVRLSSTGGISPTAQNGTTVTGFIPWYGDSTVLRMKGVEWVSANTDGKHYYYNFYDADKNFLDYTSTSIYNGGNMDHIMTVTRDENGVETTTFNTEYVGYNAFIQNVRKAAYIRISARGKGADMIVTINEEMEL